jgi:uncharacterized protein (TIGR03437 family)
LDGVEIEIGGQKAFVEYVSSTPGQVNAQLPFSIPSGGELAVTVSRENQTSASLSVTVTPTMPGLLAPASFVIAGKQYVTALLPDGTTYILPAGADPAVAARPAHPGETIALYGIGFGTVTPDIPAGVITSQPNQLSASLQILFGNTGAQVSYAGLAPGLVGLYQFNVVVPSVPDDDAVPLTFSLAGVPGTQVLYIAVHQ